MIKDNSKDLIPKFFNNTANSYDGIVNWTTFGKDGYWKNKKYAQSRQCSRRITSKNH